MPAKRINLWNHPSVDCRNSSHTITLGLTGAALLLAGMLTLLISMAGGWEVINSIEERAGRAFETEVLLPRRGAAEGRGCAGEMP